MSYIKKTLVADEKIAKHFKIHWIVYVECILFCWLIFPLIKLIKLFFIEYALTNKRVVTKAGIISRNTEEMRLVKVETVEVKQGIIGRIFGYGNVLVSGTGSSNVVFSDVDNPIEVKKSIDAHLD